MGRRFALTQIQTNVSKLASKQILAMRLSHFASALSVGFGLVVREDEQQNLRQCSECSVGETERDAEAKCQSAYDIATQEEGKNPIEFCICEEGGTKLFLHYVSTLNHAIGICF